MDARCWLAGAGVVLAACGGGTKSAAPPETTAAGAPAAMTPGSTSAGSGAASGQVVQVRMTGNGTTQAAFVPDHITIAPGTTLELVNESGWPHNFTFYPDSIPPGAASVMQAAMKNTIANLTSPLFTTPNETYDISFAGAPTGTYKAYCIPHQALGMKMTITVQ
jgi:plastocyanin